MNNINYLNCLANLNIPNIQEVLYSQGLHIGEFKYTVRSQDFNGWMLCDGRELLISDHEPLYNVIGTTFGSSDSNHFALPDYRGRALAMMGSGPGLSTRAWGQSVGEETHQLTVPEMPSHGHTVNDPGHSHTQVTYNDDYNLTNGTPPAFAKDAATNAPVTWSNINSTTTGVSLNSCGGSAAHNNMQPTLFGGNVFIFSGYSWGFFRGEVTPVEDTIIG